MPLDLDVGLFNSCSLTVGTTSNGFNLVFLELDLLS